MEQSLVVINDEDRDTSQRINDDVRTKALEALGNYIANRGYVNISEIARGMHVTINTAKELVGEVMESWAEDEEFMISSQLKWYEQQLQEVDEHPELKVLPKIDRMHIKASIFKEMNVLRAFREGTKSAKAFNAGLNALFNELKPRTRQIIEAQREIAQKNVVTGSTTNTDAVQST